MKQYRTVLEGLLFNYSGQLTDYLRNREIYDMAIFFEDVIANPERECRKLFNFLDIPMSHVPAALDTLKEDSQRGTYGLRGERPKIKPKMFIKLDQYLRDLNMPEEVTCEMSLDTLKSIVLGSSQTEI